MSLTHQGDITKELYRCRRLYQGFSEAEPTVAAVYRVVEEYFHQHPLTPLPAVDLEESSDKMKEGQRIDLNPPLQTAEVLELLQRINEALVRVNPHLKKTAASLTQRLERYGQEAPAEVERKDIQVLQETLVKGNVLEQDLATFLFSCVLSSFYQQYLRLSVEVLRTDLWEGGECPLCGEKPHFGMLRPENGAKQLECWLCGTSWVHSRIQCPFCSNIEQEDLGYFTIEGNDVCRVNFCKSCFQYCKIFDARMFDAVGDPVLPIYNLATLDYDLVARNEGFTPGSGLEWVNEREIADRQD